MRVIFAAVTRTHVLFAAPTLAGRAVVKIPEFNARVPFAVTCVLALIVAVPPACIVKLFTPILPPPVRIIFDPPFNTIVDVLYVNTPVEFMIHEPPMVYVNVPPINVLLLSITTFVAVKP